MDRTIFSRGKAEPPLERNARNTAQYLGDGPRRVDNPSFVCRILASTEKVYGHIWLVANNPTIMARCYVEDVTAFHFDHASIGERRCGRTRQYEPNMFNLQRLCPKLRPTCSDQPSRLICRAATGHTSKAHQLETAEGHFAHLIRFLEALQYHFRVFRIHGILSRGCYIRSGTVNPCR